MKGEFIGLESSSPELSQKMLAEIQNFQLFKIIYYFQLFLLSHLLIKVSLINKLASWSYNNQAGF